MERETKLDIMELSRGYLGILILSALLWSGTVSAYYPGEIIVVENNMGIDNLVYTIINNKSPVSQLNISINSTNVTIEFPGDLTPDTFDIVFLENQTHEIIQTIHHGGGGGSSRTKYVDRNVTTYVPEYIDKPIEYKDIIKDNTTVLESGYELWHLGLFLLIGLSFGGWVVWDYIKKDKDSIKK